jgi:hypothetical protein
LWCDCARSEDVHSIFIVGGFDCERICHWNDFLTPLGVVIIRIVTDFFFLRISFFFAADVSELLLAGWRRQNSPTFFFFGIAIPTDFFGIGPKKVLVTSEKNCCPTLRCITRRHWTRVHRRCSWS